jgi:hypothetical protein
VKDGTRRTGDVRPNAEDAAVDQTDVARIVGIRSNVVYVPTWGPDCEVIAHVEGQVRSGAETVVGCRDSAVETAGASNFRSETYGLEKPAAIRVVEKYAAGVSTNCASCESSDC